MLRGIADVGVLHGQTDKRALADSSAFPRDEAMNVPVLRPTERLTVALLLFEKLHLERFQ